MYNNVNRPAIFIITGEQGEGKSSFAGILAGKLKQKHLRVKGIIAEGRWSGSRRSGFDLTDPDTGIRIPLAERISGDNTTTGHLPGKREGPGKQAGRENSPPSGNTGSSGKFIFHGAAVKRGNSIIRQAITESYDIVILDEIGAMELNGEIWSEILDILLRTHRGSLLITVRKQFLDAVTGHWHIDPVAVFDISSSDADRATELIISYHSSPAAHE